MESSQPSSQPRPAISFLTLPPEIRKKIYSHLLPITISLSVNHDSGLTTPNSSTDANTAPTISNHTSSTKATARTTGSHSTKTTSKFPTIPARAPSLLHLAQVHLHHPTSSFPTALPLSYHSPTYRYALTIRFLTNATRPPFRELALTCRTIYTEMAPQVAASLSINADTLPVACVFAARLGSMARHVREVSVRRPFLGGVDKDKVKRDDNGGLDAASGSVSEDGAEQMTAWVRVMAELLPGVSRLAFAGIERMWELSEAALNRVLDSDGDGDGEERQDDENDDADMGRWGWDNNQLRVLREVVPAWEEQGGMLVPVSAKQVAGLRQISVVWEAKSSGDEQNASVWQDPQSGLSLDEEWTAYENWVAKARSRDGENGGKAIVDG